MQRLHWRQHAPAVRVGIVANADADLKRGAQLICVRFPCGLACHNRAMHLMHTLRNTPWLTRLALLWFALTLGAAVASPMVHPQQETLICSAAGMFKVKIHTDGSLSTEPTSEAHCPLCTVGSGVPQMFSNPLSAPVQAQTKTLHIPTSAPVAAATAAPPPSRGPPASL